MTTVLSKGIWVTPNTIPVTHLLGCGSQISKHLKNGERLRIKITKCFPKLTEPSVKLSNLHSIRSYSTHGVPTIS